ncbi:hypothetical protein [Sulfurimonas sp. NWX367]|uniref:hypothetical protein n=1 Tax=unclassified Sulfurimonas TaxID=2623549 RepID=UPI0032047BA9
MFGKKNQDKLANSQLIEKIAKMNLTEMRSYIKNNMKDLALSVEGANEVMKKLISFDEKTQAYFIKNDDMDIKKKKAFELFIAVLTNKHINMETIESAQKFLEIYKELINDYDTRNKQIYSSKLVETLKSAINTINQYSKLQNKMNILGK